MGRTFLAISLAELVGRQAKLAKGFVGGLTELLFICGDAELDSDPVRVCHVDGGAPPVIDLHHVFDATLVLTKCGSRYEAAQEELIG